MLKRGQQTQQAVCQRFDNTTKQPLGEISRLFSLLTRGNKVYTPSDGASMERSSTRSFQSHHMPWGNSARNFVTEGCVISPRGVMRWVYGSSCRASYLEFLSGLPPKWGFISKRVQPEVGTEGRYHVRHLRA